MLMINVSEVRLYKNGVDDTVGNIAHKGVVVAGCTKHGELFHIVEYFGYGFGGLYLAPVNFLESVLMLVRTVYLVPRLFRECNQSFGKLPEYLVVAFLHRHPYV